MNNIEILEHFCEMEDYENKEEFLQAIKNLLQENKELKEENNKLKTCDGILDVFSLGKESSRQRIEFDYIPKSKVKEKMQKDIKINDHVILGGRSNGKTLEYGKRLGRIEMCEELLEE